MKILRTLAVLAATAAALVTAAPATAAPTADSTLSVVPSPTASCPSVGTTHPYLACTNYLWHGPVQFQIVWGFDYNPANNNLRAYGYIWTSSGTTHVQFEPLRLADRNGVLKDKNANRQDGVLWAWTDPVQCHKPSGVYRSKLYFSIRWPDGSLSDGNGYLKDIPASSICK